MSDHDRFLPSGIIELLEEDISRRDLFAAMVLQGLITRDHGGGQHLVQVAVKYADALCRALDET